LPLLAALDEARDEWRQFYEYAKSDRADEDFFEHEFRGGTIEAADRNTGTNDRRQAYLYRDNVAINAIFVLTVASGALSFLSVMFKL
jgi:hypothetical protein